MLVARLGGKDAFESKLKKELPAVLYYLIYEFQVPAKIKEENERMGVRGYQNPDLMSEIEGTAPEMQLLEALLTFSVRDGNSSERLQKGDRLDFLRSTARALV